MWRRVFRKINNWIQMSSHSTSVVRNCIHLSNDPCWKITFIKPPESCNCYWRQSKDNKLYLVTKTNVRILERGSLSIKRAIISILLALLRRCFVCVSLSCCYVHADYKFYKPYSSIRLAWMRQKQKHWCCWREMFLLVFYT